jgi:hypothetical protein
MSPAALDTLFRPRPFSPEEIRRAQLISAKAERAARSHIRRMNKQLETLRSKP